jgi:PAS domain S-box-containing protein
VSAGDASYYLGRVADRSRSMLAYWDHQLICRYANQAYRHWFGIDGSKLIGTSLRDLLGPTLFALNEPYIKAVLRGEEQVFERVVPGPGGVQRHSLASYVPDFADGQVIGFMVEVTETTRIKQAEAALRESLAALDRTGRLARVGGWQYDLRTGVSTWSSQIRDIYEVGAEYVPMHQANMEFFEPAGRLLLADAVDRCARDGTSWDLELPFTSARGRALWVRSFGERELDSESGVPVRLVGALQDITEQRLRKAELLQEQTLRAQVEQHARDLGAALRERSEMLDVLAHEVRQPLNNASAALQSATGALLDAGESAASSRLAKAQVVVGQVIHSIDNTLAVASLLARPGAIQFEDTDIDTLVGVAVADQPASERGRIRVERLCATRTASMDMSLMRLALSNLLSNALAWSPHDAPVTVRLSDSEDPLALVIEVIDGGPGFSPDLLPHLFERGTRERASGRPGLGLGMYIVRRVMELHGGSARLVRNGPAGATLRLVIVQ